jgi:hypothetical protein
VKGASSVMSKTAATNKSSLSDPTIPTIEEGKDGSKGSSLKFDYDLYKEEDNVVLPTFRVKRIALPNKGERWKVMCGTQIVCLVEGSKLNKREKLFLRSLDGVNWLLAQAKVGIRSFNALKIALKKKMSQP